MKLATVVLLLLALDGDPLLHEPFPTPTEDISALTVGELVEGAPLLKVAGNDGAGTYTLPKEYTLDGATQADETLFYDSVFEPSVVPFKRILVLDRVDSSYRLYPSKKHIEPVAVGTGGFDPTTMEVFEGSWVLEPPTPGAPAILPSVAPDAIVLSLVGEPDVPVAITRDASGTFYVTAEHDGAVSLAFSMAAPSTYFEGPIPASASYDYIPAGLAPALPPKVEATALEVADAIGVVGGTSYTKDVAALVEYFRGFEAGAPPPSGPDLYKALTLAKKGVCRHRSAAFVITALALGIPARFVSNEAHAFVEVYVPLPGGGYWKRVDLGGASDNLVVTGASPSKVHSPPTDDGLPKPDAYTSSSTTVIYDATSAPPSSTGDPTGEPSSSATSSAEPSPPPATPPSAAEPGPPSAVEESTTAGVTPLDLPVTLQGSSYLALKGATFTLCGGVVTPEDASTTPLFVVIYAQDTTAATPPTILRFVVPGDDGSFCETIPVPSSLTPGTYELSALPFRQP